MNHARALSTKLYSQISRLCPKIQAATKLLQFMKTPKAFSIHRNLNFYLSPKDQRCAARHVYRFACIGYDEVAAAEMHGYGGIHVGTAV